MMNFNIVTRNSICIIHIRCISNWTLIDNIATIISVLFVHYYYFNCRRIYHCYNTDFIYTGIRLPIVYNHAVMLQVRKAINHTFISI